MKLIVLFSWLSNVLSCPNDKNCRACHNDGPNSDCLLCFDSTLLPSGTCSAKINLTPRCLLYKPGSDICEKCEYGYYLKENSCKACSEYSCAICRENGECYACWGGILARNGVCSDEFFHDLNCEIPRDRSCLKCKSGFSLNDNSECVPGIPHCETVHSQPFKCAVCDNGYYIKADGLCEGSISDDSYIILIIGGSFAGIFGIIVILCLCRRKKQPAEIDESLT